MALEVGVWEFRGGARRRAPMRGGDAFSCYLRLMFGRFPPRASPTGFGFGDALRRLALPIIYMAFASKALIVREPPAACLTRPFTCSVFGFSLSSSRFSVHSYIWLRGVAARSWPFGVALDIRRHPAWLSRRQLP